jgi:hypothetical protein
MAAILKMLEAKGGHHFLSMRSTYLHTCFDSRTLLELEATPAKGKTHNSTLVYELNSFP